ncbi:MAG: InlB B-repeat-containing protein [Clostridia bacterium]|nr:InlB B-repeat-containing protein [Clostridia bacterium]
MTDRRKFIALYVMLVTVVSVAVIGLSSWLIVPTTSNPGTHEVEDDTSPAFTTEAYFTGEAQAPFLNSVGELIYDGFVADNSNGAYALEWISGEYFDKTPMPDNVPNEYKGRIAGTHYYKITDNTTGQIIAQNHKFVIKQDTFTVSVQKPAPAFEGDEITFDITLKGVNSGITHSIKTSRMVLANSYEYDVETAQMVSTKTVTQVLADNYSLSGISSTNFGGINSNNFTLGTITYSLEYDILPTCYNGSQDAKTVYSYYGNLTKAIKSSSSGTIFAMQTFEHDGKTYVVTTGKDSNGNDNGDYTHSIETSTLRSGVALAIPYDEHGSILNREYNKTGDSSKFIITESNVANVYNPTLTNKVTMAPGAVLTIESGAALNIGGVLGIEGQGYSSGPAGVTSGRFAMLQMGANAAIKSAGEIRAFGYITQQTPGNGSYIDNGTSAGAGTVYMPFLVHDYHGGSHTSGAYTEGSVSPFNIFDMPNIHATLNCTYSSSIIAYASLHTGEKKVVITIAASYNTTTMKIFGPSDALITMTSGSASFKYDPDNAYTEGFGTTVTKPNINAKTEVNLRGDAKSGAMSMLVKAITEQTVDLSSVVFPISYKFTLNLDGNYNYSFNTRYKFLPGSVLNVGSGATLTVSSNSSLLFYDDYKDSSGVDKSGSVTILSLYYPTQYRHIPAECNISGTLVVKGGFGGTVTACSNEARLDLSGASDISGIFASEGNGGWEGISGTYAEIYAESHASNAVLKRASSSKNENLNKQVYYGNSDGSWCEYRIKLTYNYLNGSAAQQVYVNYWSNNLTLTAEHMLDASRTHYTFGGWYTDAEYTVAANGQTVTDGANLYARWTPKQYTVEYSYLKSPNGADIPPPNSIEFNIEGGVITLPKPVSELAFVGWYVDENLESPLDCTDNGENYTIEFAELINHLPEGSDAVTLYGLWSAIRHTITFEDVEYSDELDRTVNIGADGRITKVISPAQLNNSLPTVAYFRNESRDKYFVKWVLVNDDGSESDISDYSFASRATESREYTIKAVYNQKVKFNLDYGDNGISLTNPTVDIWLRQGETYQLADVTVGDDLHGVGKYFDAWTLVGCEIAGSTITVTAASGTASATAKWKNKHTVSFYDGSTLIETIFAKPNGTVELASAPTKTGHTFRGWYTASSGGEKVGNAGAEYKVTGDVMLYAQRDINSYTIKVTTSNATVTVNGKVVDNNGTVSIQYGEQVTVEVSYSQTKNQSNTIAGADGTTYSSPFTMPAQNVTIDARSEEDSGCFAEGTLITMADGTQKPIEDLAKDDVILVYDHESGELTYMSNLFIINNGYNSYPLLRLFFSDGTSFDILFEHGLYDLTTNRYELLSPENVDEFIGHEFYMNKHGEGMAVTLVSYEVDVIETVCYSLMTPLYINHFANGLLCVSDGISGLYNIFEYDDDMKIDQEKKAADIEKYGISLYEEWADVFTYEQYMAFNVQYYHIIIGKGLCTDADIQYYIEKYLTRFE